jgi:hypothetical protein
VPADLLHPANSQLPGRRHAGGPALLRVPPGRGLAIHGLMDLQLRLIGSAWFTSGEGQEMADLIEAGLLDLSVLGAPRILPRERR